MQRAYATLGVTAAAVSGIIVFVHWRQRTERARMHRGVVNDIRREQLLLSAAVDAAAAAAVAAAGTPGDAVCVSGVCDLAETRFRDPVTGAVTAAPAT